jgi:hypothetical protein
LQARTQEAEQTNCFLVCAFASVTGWTPEVVEYVGGGDRHTVFHHRLVLPVLVDLACGRVYRDRLDGRFAAYGTLFAPKLASEEIDEARRYAEARVLSSHRSVSAAEVAQTLDTSSEVVDQAFAELKSCLWICRVSARS